MVQPKTRRLASEAYADMARPDPVNSIANLPPASADNRGLTIFVIAENEMFYSNGTAWTSTSQGAQGVPGPAGPGIPAGGSAFQIIRKNSAGTTTEWVSLSKSLAGLANVDNTSDFDKPVSVATQNALDKKADSTGVNVALAGKANLVGGRVPVSELPSSALVNDATVSAQVNEPETGAAIDRRVSDIVTPVVEQITADYIASDQSVIDAAVAAVDANPKILALEEAIPVEGQRAEREAISASEKLAVDGAATGTVRNLLPNAGPYAASPAWLSPNWGTGGAGTRAYAESPNAASGRGYMRNTWTTAATAPNYSFRTLPGVCAPGRFYAGSISVWSSRKTVLGAVLYFYDSAGVQISSGYNRLYEVPAGVVTKLDVNGYQAPAGAVSVRLSVNANQALSAIPQAGDIIDLSGAVVVEGGQVPDFFDGDTRGSYWVTADHEVSEAVTIAPAKLGEAARAPVAAGARNGMFYRGKRLYMPPGADLSSLRRRVKAALDGKNSFRLAWLGHSIVAGQGGTPGTVDNVRLLQQRASQVGLASTGMVTAVNNTTVDSRITFDPEWESIGAPRTNMQLHRRCLVAGKSFTYKSDTAGTIVDIYTFGNGSAVTYSIDGGAPVTITPTGTSAVQVTTVTGLSNAKHTVVITSTTTTAAYLLGVSVRGSVGLEIGNFGYSGSIAYDWTPTYFTASARFYNGYNGVFTSWNADAAIIQLGANELIHGFAPAELESNLNAIIDAARVAGKDIVLVLDTPVEDATRTTWFSQYVPTVYSVADAQRVPLVDFTAHWINRSVAAAQSFYADQWHPNNTGYYNLHGVMADLLLP